MSHRRVHSHGTVPFSWEHSPGVSKIIWDDNVKLSSAPPAKTKLVDVEFCRINPPPPCPKLQGSRSGSAKGMKWREEDPFVAAYKECTRNKGRKSKKKGGGCSDKLVVRSKLIFSCKNSSDVEEDSFLKLSKLPPIRAGSRVMGRR